ncbi:MAG: SPOR domain-containing protein [Xanthomonadales bacterium]|nr:SPOR domain-containing protein [Xanthomonadales bacterium]
MAVKRKSAGNRRGARSKASRGVPAWFWLLGGILIGLGAAVFLMVRGYLPEIQQHLPTLDNKSAEADKSSIVEEEIAKPKKPRYDFFTVLPEMEVVVPEQELSRKADKTEAVSDSSITTAQDQYILQAGSFRNATDAEQMKARLAMLGSMATVQKVTVNGQTWHRVRIGPFQGARKADEIRRLLSDNNIDTLVMKANP